MELIVVLGCNVVLLVVSRGRSMGTWLGTGGFPPLEGIGKLPKMGGWACTEDGTGTGNWVWVPLLLKACPGMSTLTNARRGSVSDSDPRSPVPVSVKRRSGGSVIG